MDFNSILNGTSSAIRSSVMFTADVASKGLSTINQGTAWTGRQVTALGPVLQQVACSAACQLSRLAFTALSIAIKTLAILSSVAQQGYQAVTLLVKAHPLVSSGATGAAIAIALTLITQRMLSKPASA